jgi:UDP-N-acetylmuramyl pentapeptide phosphotransferase/UDP-N-acetylglucosamine-1-phosphate transferase
VNVAGTLWPLFGAMGAAALVALAIGRAMIDAGLADQPDALRKLHRAPTPTAGGLAIVGGVGAGALALLAISGPAALSGMTPALALLAIGAALGLADDLLVLGAGPKLAVMSVVAIAVAATGTRVDALDFGAPDMGAGALERVLHLPLFLAVAGSALWLLVMVNAVNFLDGANGMAMGCLALGLTGLAALSGMAGAGGPAALAAVAAAACAGFLVWNAPSGRLFAGDAGALGAGLLAGALGLWAGASGVPVWGVALCFLPILADAILTVAWRASKGRDLSKPHRDHAYQIGIRAGVSHRHMALLYWGLTLHCCVSAFAGSLFGAAGALVALIVNALVAVWLHRKVRAYAAATGHDGD